MTIAISIKVNDGVVLAADSASTMITQDPSTGNIGVSNVYNNANKVYNLHKNLPVGAITWGSGSIGQASIATLAKDFRELITCDSEWKVDQDNYTVKDVADKFFRFMYESNYSSTFNFPGEKPELGFIVAGYSSSAKMAEEWIVEINNEGFCNGPVLSRQEQESGASWHGQPEAISRLIMGFGYGLPNILSSLGLTEQQVVEIINICKNSLQAPLVIPPMPIQDAIDLAEFLVDLTIKFTRFNTGAQTVGGPIEIAAITKHEGFKWVRRKHYYSVEYNRN